MSWTLGLEAIAIMAVLLLPWPATKEKTGLSYFIPTGLLSLAMGLQNASLIRVGASSVYTTHVTGNLTRLAREAAHAVLPIAGANRGRSRRRVAFMAAMWSTYTIGALFGAAAVAEWKRYAAIAALIVLLVLVTIDLLQPLGGHEAPAEPDAIF
jgi:uncharacterized membrane protein YoaK (UPF0700 family)